MFNNQKWARLVGGLASLALFAAACSPTPTPTLVAVLTGVTATSTKAAAQPPTATATATATATEVVVPDDDTNSEATTTGTPPALDVCDMITDSEAAKILGEPVTRAQSGTDDSETYPIHFCTWHVATPSIALLLSVTDVGSQGAAVSQLEAQLAANEDDATFEEDIDAEQAGVGERVFWTVSENAAGFDISTGSHVYALAVGGQVTPTDELRAALLALAKVVSGRM